ncbi:AcrR family transcriptional regulator [Rhodobium orientis]|uniref:HTH tetR-type domain-containing protein n=1 Tax=Rhodobium orientis TaxID=34017 RepID=A0A327JTA0_9HYPH|nr:TetR/AcrR family transcriptional regulator [Rhodobium orientis]MBB4304352.1 AcrR family transcriptional regulator [Rhodobium orientis]MBK5948154.1 hypothetical protein [Rhodobium orientis]RAI28845.1 hypothetical protein CH339_05480 [Rhodobium orientis]
MARKTAADKRNRLVEAAAKLFWTKGYAGASLADIATEADVPLGNVYYYFKSKAALARAVADMFVDDVERKLDEIEGTGAPATARLSAILGVMAQGSEDYDKHGCQIAAAIRDFSAFDKDTARRAGEAFEMLERRLQETLVDTGVATDVARRRAERTVTEWQGAIVTAQGTRDADRLHRAFRDMADDLGCLAP